MVFPTGLIVALLGRLFCASKKSFDATLESFVPHLFLAFDDNLLIFFPLLGCKNYTDFGLSLLDNRLGLRAELIA
jgi:hypothetical protein